MEKLLKVRNCLSMEEIQSYLAGKSDKEETFSVENHLLDCPLCRDAVEGYASLNQNGKSGLFYLFLVALLVTATVSMYFRMSGDQRLFNSHFEVYTIPADISSVSTSPEIADLIEKASALYKAKSYDQSAHLWDQILDSIPENTQVLLLSGLSKMEAERYLEALSSLDQIAGKKETPYAEDGQWYMALLFLKTGDVIRCKEVLAEIRNREGKYREKATKLLKEL